MVKEKWICVMLITLGVSSVAQDVRSPISPSLELRLTSSEIHELSIRALKGDNQSAKTLASCYGIGYRDYQKMDEWYLIGAENNDAGAQYSVSIINLRNSISELDRERRCYWLYRAIKNGYSDALDYKDTINENIYLLEKRQEKVERVIITRENLERMKIRAMRGNGIIALKIAEFYEKLANKEMVFWFRIGAQNENRDSMRKYGNYLMNTNDELNKIRGSFWLTRSRSAN
jgi:hypothetical protein